jgi:hypothetical protein
MGIRGGVEALDDGIYLARNPFGGRECLLYICAEDLALWTMRPHPLSRLHTLATEQFCSRYSIVSKQLSNLSPVF